MRTSFDIPDSLLQRARAEAAQRGIPLRQLVCEALTEKLRDRARDDKPWMKGFGKLRSSRQQPRQTVAGEKRPQGASLKLLCLVSKNGLQAVA